MSIPTEPYPGVRILPPEPKPEPVIIEEREPEPVILFLVTCASAPECPETFQGHGSYFMAWQQAVGAGWRTDVSRQRRCPVCVAARRPSPTMYVAEDALGGWLRRTDWLRQMAGPDAASVALGAPALPIVAGVATPRPVRPYEPKPMSATDAAAFAEESIGRAAPQPDPASHPYPVPAVEPEGETEQCIDCGFDLPAAEAVQCSYQTAVAYRCDQGTDCPHWKAAAGDEDEPEPDPEEDAPAGRAVADDEPATDATAVLVDLAREQEAAMEPAVPEATAVLPVTEAPTEAVPVVETDGGES